MIDDAIDSVEPDSPAVRRLWRFALTCLVAVLALACSNPSGANDPAAALREAAGRGDTAAVRALLEQGAPVDARDDQGATALVRAAYGNHVDAAALLVQAGADVDLADDTRQSAYLIATSEVGDDPRLLDLTLGAGADIDAKDSYDGTGLIRAAERAHVTDRRAAAAGGHRPRPRQPPGLHRPARGRRLRRGRARGPGDGRRPGRRRSRAGHPGRQRGHRAGPRRARWPAGGRVDPARGRGSGLTVHYRRSRSNHRSSFRATPDGDYMAPRVTGSTGVAAMQMVHSSLTIQEAAESPLPGKSPEDLNMHIASLPGRRLADVVLRRPHDERAASGTTSSGTARRRGRRSPRGRIRASRSRDRV